MCGVGICEGECERVGAGGAGEWWWREVCDPTSGINTKHGFDISRCVGLVI